MPNITKLKLQDDIEYTLSAPILLDQEESDSTTSAPSSAYIKSKIDDINSRINSLNTTIQEWAPDIPNIDSLMTNWTNMTNRIYNFNSWYIRHYENANTNRVITITMNNVDTAHHMLIVWGDANNIGFFGILYRAQPVWIEGQGSTNTLLSVNGDNSNAQYAFRLPAWSGLYVACTPFRNGTPENYYTVSYTAY